jgi:hypothetical protein
MTGRMIIKSTVAECYIVELGMKREYGSRS